MSNLAKPSNSIFRAKKHNKAIDKKHALHSMLTKGNTKAQITTATQNSKIEKVYCNKRLILIIKLIKIVYFTGRKKWILKFFFHDFMKYMKT